MEKSPVSLSATSSSPSPAATSKWILLVDDEPAILQLLETVLSEQGRVVRVAKNAEDATAAVDSAPTPPVLLICDVLMPGVDGLEMARRLVARLPLLKVIFISGHLEDISWWPADLCEYRFVGKPFTNEQLSQVVTEVLADHGDAR
jgi:two-component system, cell cycle sensor histidine kinase and response regulator CckA